MRHAFLLALLAAQDFTIQTTNTTENLRGLSTLSPMVVWASGTHGTYLRTLDAGESWAAAHVPGAESLDFRDVEAFSADAAYLLSAGSGELSRIYKTTDGGRHWTLQFTNKDPKGFFDCMAFWDRHHGIALGDPVDGKFELITTDNGGKNWRPISPLHLPPAIDGEGAFAASGTCITVAGKNNVWFATGGTTARVFHSADRGTTWTAVETPIAHGNDSSGIFSIAFRDAKHGVIAGGDYKHPDQLGTNLAFTEDGGKTWKLSTLAPQPYVSAVAFAPERHMERRASPPVGAERSSAASILVVGSAQAAYSTDPRKTSWTKLWDLNLNAITFDSSGSAWAAGPKGLVVHLTIPRP